MTPPTDSLEAERGSIREVVLAFLRLGCTSFGGPVAHLGYFQNELVQRRRWVSEATFADVVALCQFLPGPASSQTCFVLGTLRSGLLGGFLGWMAFTLPSALLMIGFAYGVHAIDVASQGWLRGLKVAAVAVVAQAVWLMGRKLCPDVPRFALAAVCTAVLIATHMPALQPALIVAGALFGLAVLRGPAAEAKDQPNFAAGLHLSRRLAVVSLVLFGILLAASLLWRNGPGLVDLFARFYRTGSLVFGGGHVVLPLLEGETVRSGLVSHDVFLSGYGAAQALPGPLFTFAAFLGASINSGWPPWFAGAWCLGAILLPSLLLIVGVLPFWAGLMDNARAQAALKGANAAVVGLLIAAFYDPVCTSGLTSAWTVVVALAAFALLQFARLPNWAVVLL
ncbi:MAG TPA: chromate efflux transporter, partial [Candidatus Methylacidiphilales bacterium]|nr:chromate efflux transporter [Candidatus Methylacidiphilales bacterium]